MNDILGILANLRRPQLLIRTARIGVSEYCRDPHLRRLLGPSTLPRSGQALAKLMEIEADINQQRRANDAGYSVVRHVDVLIAMMGEARLLRTASPSVNQLATV